MNDLEGFHQAIERLDQIAADLAVSHSGLQERSSEIKKDREALSKLTKDLRADVTALQDAFTKRVELLRAEQQAATVKSTAANMQDLGNRLKGVVASEVQDGLRGLWRLTLGLAVGIVLLLGWMYFRDPVSSRLKKLEEEARTQERMAALTPYVKLNGRGEWIVQVEKGSVFRGADGQQYARLPGK